MIFFVDKIGGLSDKNIWKTEKYKFGMLPLTNTRNISLECKNMSSYKNLTHFSQILTYGRKYKLRIFEAYNKYKLNETQMDRSIVQPTLRRNYY